MLFANHGCLPRIQITALQLEEQSYSIGFGGSGG
jgi:hypothetical protein